MMTLSGWHSLWQVLTVVSLAFAFAGGLGTYLTGKWLSAKQATEITDQAGKIAALKDSTEEQKGTNLELATELEKQRKETAIANLRAEEAIRHSLEIRRAIGDRFVSPEENDAFVEASKNAPKPELIKVVPYDHKDDEASTFAVLIMWMLQKAGYKAEHISTLQWQRAGGTAKRVSEQSSIIAIRIQVDGGSDFEKWALPLKANLQDLGHFGSVEASDTPSILPERGGIIIVGPKPRTRISPQ